VLGGHAGELNGGKDDQVAIALSATAASPHERRPSPYRYALKANGGCPTYYYRGAGGKCVYYGAERPDGYYGYSYRQPYRPYKYSQP
jgi:hypothetical protein